MALILAEQLPTDVVVCVAQDLASDASGAAHAAVYGGEVTPGSLLYPAAEPDTEPTMPAAHHVAAARRAKTRSEATGRVAKALDFGAVAPLQPPQTEQGLAVPLQEQQDLAQARGGTAAARPRAHKPAGASRFGPSKRPRKHAVPK